MINKNNKNNNERAERTFKQGVGGAILGAVIGAPGLGMALGMLNANKDKLKNVCDNGCNKTQPSDKKPVRARDDPAGYFFK